MKKRVLKVEEIDSYSGYGRDFRITVKYIPNWIERKFLCSRERTKIFQGVGTVWHKYPSGLRAETSMEIWLYDKLTWAQMTGIIEVI